MSGRAGRRGLDDKGIVILMVDEKLSPAAGLSCLLPNTLILLKHVHLCRQGHCERTARPNQLCLPSNVQYGLEPIEVSTEQRQNLFHHNHMKET